MIAKRFVFMVIAGLVGCARQPNTQMESSRNIITEQEIIGSGAETAYDVIKKLRGNFLSSVRGPTTINNQNTPKEPVVFLDDQLFGPVSALKQIQATQVGQIRLYRSWEATTKFGTGYMAGVIAVTTRQ